MSRKLISFALAATCVAAQSAPAPTFPGFSREHPVASPNRTLFPPGALASKAGQGGGSQARPLMVVDSLGVILGQLVGGQTVLLKYNQQLMAVPLGADVNANFQATSGGFNWQSNSFWHTSTDCSGTPYAPSFPYGTRYIGYSTFVTGQPYIYVIDSNQGAEIAYQSVYDGMSATCFVSSGSYWLTPVSDSLPAAPLGTPPFFLN